MKNIKDFINESEDELQPIDDQWLNDENPVQTTDGHDVMIMSIDRSRVPNIIKGKVKFDSKLLDFEWQDDGTCIKAEDQYGAVKRPADADKLVKKIEEK